VSRANEKPRPGGTGALRTEGGGSGGCGEYFHPYLVTLSVASPSAPLHLIAKDHRVLSVAQQCNSLPRIAPLQSDLFKPRMILRERLCAKAIANPSTSPSLLCQSEHIENISASHYILYG
jgi:hypothetical protein